MRFYSWMLLISATAFSLYFLLVPEVQTATPTEAERSHAYVQCMAQNYRALKNGVYTFCTQNPDRSVDVGSYTIRLRSNPMSAGYLVSKR